MESSSKKWVPLVRNYTEDSCIIPLKQTSVTSHPLASQISVTFANASTSNTVTAPTKKFSDPLRAIFAGASDIEKKQAIEIDPLRAFSVMASLESPVPKVIPGKPFKEWGTKRAAILKKYTTDAKLAVVADFLDEKVAEENRVVIVDHAKHRLEQLNKNAEEAPVTMVNQKELISKLETLNQDLKTAWEAGERVSALKISIQTSKMLGDVRVPQFYPSMFTLVADLLQSFGIIVFKRIKDRSVADDRGIPVPGAPTGANFKPADVCPDAKETCKNWFYKTACIRELMPRLYVEMAIVECYKFLCDDQFVSIFRRLGLMIRGIGDPLAAVYARVFLLIKARDICGNDMADVSELALAMLDDTMFTFSQTRRNEFASLEDITNKTITVKEYVTLYEPALQFICQVAAYCGTHEVFQLLLKQYQELCSDTVFLYYLLVEFDDALVAKSAYFIAQLIKEAKETALPKSQVYLALGQAIAHHSPPSEHRLLVLNESWRVIAKISDIKEYCAIAEVFVEYVIKHFKGREINILFTDILKHAKKNYAYREVPDSLLKILSSVLNHITEFEEIINMESFLSLLDLLDKKGAGFACRCVLQSFMKNAKPTSDPVIIHAVFAVARNLHDSLDSLSFDDDRRQIAELIVGFIRKIDFGKDLEHHLSTLVESRAAFSNLDVVTRELIYQVIKLAMRAYTLMNGRHSRKTSAFVKACFAYAHITIPCLDNHLWRLNLFLLCGELSLANQLVVQSEAFITSAIRLIPELPLAIEREMAKIHTSQYIVSYILHLSSFLLLFPGHPDQGPFYLIKGLIRAVDTCPIISDDAEIACEVQLGFLSLLCAYYQSKFPYHVPFVESNDTLYNGAGSYCTELCSIIDATVERVFAHLTTIGERKALKKQGALALQLADFIASHLELNKESATLVVRLVGLFKKHTAKDPYFDNFLSHVKRKEGSWYRDLAKKLEES